jgi:tRNA dimethylallyltransferase
MLLTGKPLVVLVGPTAVGKTGLAIEIAKALNGEIIGADSRQIYREMDIGTAKPTPDQQQQVPHHLLDVVDPDERLTVAQYQKMVYQIINNLHQRGSLPLLVGGTGQYVSAVVEGWSIPEVPPNAKLRAELEAFAVRHGSAALHQRLAQVDPVAAENIDHRNVRRVVRALEVCLESNQPISELQRKRPPLYAMLHYGLTLDRERLYAQADQRVNEMMKAGFLDEVQQLLDKGYDRHLPSMSGLGYAQLTTHLMDRVSLEEAVAQTKYDTHDFIRRQFTWFRGHNPGILWHNMAQVESSAIIESTAHWLQEQT